MRQALSRTGCPRAAHDAPFQFPVGRFLALSWTARSWPRSPRASSTFGQEATEKAARILGVTVGSARLARKRIWVRRQPTIARRTRRRPPGARSGRRHFPRANLSRLRRALFGGALALDRNAALFPTPWSRSGGTDELGRGPVVLKANRPRRPPGNAVADAVSGSRDEYDLPHHIETGRHLACSPALLPCGALGWLSISPQPTNRRDVSGRCSTSAVGNVRHQRRSQRRSDAGDLARQRWRDTRALQHNLGAVHRDLSGAVQEVLEAGARWAGHQEPVRGACDRNRLPRPSQTLPKYP